MTFKGCLDFARSRLDEAGIDEAELESRILLQHAAKLNAVDLLLRYDKEPEPNQAHEYWRLIERRLDGEPSAYIMGRREFFGLEFTIDSGVLIPRPETEILVERTLAAAEGRRHPDIADIGTGSGAVAVSLAKYLTDAVIYATDSSEIALRVAQYNAARHGVMGRINFSQGDLLEALTGPVDIIAANLPYVPTGEVRSAHEPRQALDGGPQGLDVIGRFCRGLPGRLFPGGSTLLEVGQGQAEDVSAMLRANVPSARVSVFNDLAGIPRVVQATLPAGIAG
jgi:release factor glutamine methyltransferase